MKSETIGKLAEALAKAQGQMDAAKKDSTNPFFKNKYADLASVIEAIKEPLAKNGLSYTQYLEESCEQQYVVTELIHSSGEWIKGSMRLIIGGKSDMQALGAAFTYGRRFSLSAIIGITQDDDDGNATQKPKAAVGPIVPTVAPVPDQFQMMWNTKYERLKSVIKSKPIDPKICSKYIQDNCQPAVVTKDLNVEQLAEMIDWAERYSPPLAWES